MLVNHLRGGKLTQIPQKLMGQEVALNETMELILKFLKWGTKKCLYRKADQ